MTDSDADYATGTHREDEEIPTIAPEKEPEYVGAHSGLNNDQCTNYKGRTKSEVRRCENDATHTVVMYDGKLHEMGMCDDCGEPDDVEDFDREWSA